MNFQTGRAHLMEHYKTTARQWQRLGNTWKDQKAEEFNKDYMQALERHVKMSLSAIEEVDEIFERLRQECGL